MLTLILIVVITTKLSFLNLSYKSMNIYIFIKYILASKIQASDYLSLCQTPSLNPSLDAVHRQVKYGRNKLDKQGSQGTTVEPAMESRFPSRAHNHVAAERATTSSCLPWQSGDMSVQDSGTSVSHYVTGVKHPHGYR